MNERLQQYIVRSDQASDAASDNCRDKQSCNFGHLRQVFRFEEAVDESCNSKMDRGCPTAYEIIIDIQPIAEESMITKEGHRSVTKYNFWYAPNDEFNSTAFNGEPFYLVGSDSKYTSGGFVSSSYKHSDLVEFLGARYMISELKNWAGEDCDCIADDGDVVYLQEGIITLYNDEFSERDANIDNDTFAFDGELRSK